MSFTIFSGTKSKLTLENIFHLEFLKESHCNPGWLQKKNDFQFTILSSIPKQRDYKAHATASSLDLMS